MGAATTVAVVAVAALAVVAARPNAHDVMIGLAGVAFRVGLGVAIILAAAIPVGWVAWLWRRTRRHRGRFVLGLALTVAVIAALVALVLVLLPAAPATLPEA